MPSPWALAFWGREGLIFCLLKGFKDEILTRENTAQNDWINYTHPVTAWHPSVGGNFLKTFHCLVFYSHSGEECRGGLYFSLFSSSCGAAKSNMKVYPGKSYPVNLLIDEPSNPIPSWKAYSNSSIEMAKLFRLPKTSVNHNRINFTRFSWQGSLTLAKNC